MTDLNEAAAQFCREARWANLAGDELQAALVSHKRELVMWSGYLLYRAGGDRYVVEAENARALNLPSTVLIRRANEGMRLIADTGACSVEHAAAIVAAMLRENVAGLILFFQQLRAKT